MTAREELYKALHGCMKTEGYYDWLVLLIDAVIAEEREACAKVADEVGTNEELSPAGRGLGLLVRDRIRARGDK